MCMGGAYRVLGRGMMWEVGVWCGGGLGRKERGGEYLEPRAGERVKHVRFGEDTIIVDLVDGRTITVLWFVPSVLG